MKFSRRNMLKYTAAGLAGMAAGGRIAEAAVREDEVQKDPLLVDAPIIDADDYAARIVKARRLMAENKLDGLMVTNGTGLKYFSGVDWWPSERLFAMVIPAEGDPAFVCPAFEEGRAREQTGTCEVRTWHEHENPFEVVKGLFDDRKLTAARIGIEERVRYFEYEGLARVAPGFELVPADAVTIGCRAIKTDKELELMRRANQLTVKVYARAHRKFAEGMVEDDVRTIITEEFARAGIAGGAMALHGENSAYPHGTANRKPLTDGTVILIDGGCSLNGFRADITRTLVFGEPTAKQRQVWDLVKKAQEAALGAAVAPNPCGSVDDAARKVICDGGFGPDYRYFTHRLGHGIGMDGHEWPYLVRGNELPLAPGMTFSNEPGIYIMGEFGIRHEDIMFINAEGKGELFTRPMYSIDEPFKGEE